MLLKWTREKLSEASSIDVRTIANIELGDTVPPDSTAVKLRGAMEAARVEFQSGEISAGVRLRPR
ncbi:MAG: helix-turn-helix transcriptional regulator [Proteobacteria bacterium]|nr:helix-turn-helix transcriptional regulator [Pseudomonadota bacterium]